MSPPLNESSKLRVAINGSGWSSAAAPEKPLKGAQPAPQKYGACDAPMRAHQQQQQPSDTQPLGWLEKAAARVPCLGILLSLGASFFLGSAGMLVKMTTSVHGVQVAVLRATIQLLVYLVIILIRRLPLIPRRRQELVPVMLRASLGAASITCSYFALKLIPLGDATVIRFSLPIWTLIVSYLLLNESCSLLKVLAVVVSMSGVLLIAKPDTCVYLAQVTLNSLGLMSDEQLQLNGADYDAAKLLLARLTPEESWGQLKGCLLALSSSVCLAMSLIALRLCKRTPAEVTILWLSIYSIVIGSLLLVYLQEWRLPSNLPDCAYILLNGLCGAAGQWFITSALKVEQSGVISLARTADIQVAFLYSFLLLHEQIRATSIVGSILVSSGVLAVVIPQWLAARSRARQTRRLADAESASSPPSLPPSSQPSQPPPASSPAAGGLKRPPAAAAPQSDQPTSPPPARD